MDLLPPHTGFVPFPFIAALFGLSALLDCNALPFVRLALPDFMSVISEMLFSFLELSISFTFVVAELVCRGFGGSFLIYLLLLPRLPLLLLFPLDFISCAKFSEPPVVLVSVFLPLRRLVDDRRPVGTEVL